MYKINNDVDLKKLTDAGVGFVYNEYSGTQKRNRTGNILHSANCPNAKNCNTKTDKYFFESIEEELKWLNDNRGREGENWRKSKCRNKKCSL